MFKEILNEWIKRNNLSRKEFIALLQSKDYSSFQGLDAITLSRWTQGKSTPPLERQFRIAVCLGEDLVEFLLNVEAKRPSCKALFALKELERAIDMSMNNLSYLKLKSERCEIQTVNYSEYLSQFGDFYHNISAIKCLREALSKNRNRIDYDVVLLKNADGGIVGHWVVLDNLSGLKELDVFSKLTDKELNEGVLLKLAYFNNTNQMFELIVSIVCYYVLLMDKKNKKSAYIHLMSFPILAFAKLVFRAEEIKYYPPLNDDNGIYLVRIDIAGALTSPLLLPMIKARLKCLTTCDGIKCNRCNLQVALQRANIKL